MTKKVAIALSGGIDSAVTAYLLKQEGYEVFAVTMTCHEFFNDMEDAKKVADFLGIKHYAIDMKDSFDKKVLEPFADKYFKGHTPNPCIICNKWIKYGEFMDKALELGADYFATGHYARIVNDKGTYKLMKAKSDKKNQAYVLHVLTQDRLSKILLPLGEYETKDEIRDIARKIGLEVADKKDSVNLCFSGGKKHGEYLRLKHPGRIVSGQYKTMDGKVLGEHPSIIYHTIGQKRNLFIPTSEKRVISIDHEDNTVYLGNEDDLYHDKLSLTDITLTREIELDQLEVEVQMFQWGYFLKGKLVKSSSGFHLLFTEAVRAIAKGQHAVFYLGDEVIGGGLIKEILKQ